MTEVRYDAIELMPNRWWFCADEWPGHRLWTVGYCSDKAVCPSCEGEGADWNGLVCIVCLGNCSVRVPDPCKGHDSPHGAREHWIGYLVDNADLDGIGPDLRICEAPGCTRETQRFARVRGAESALCGGHRNYETLYALLLSEATVNA